MKITSRTKLERIHLIFGPGENETVLKYLTKHGFTPVSNKPVHRMTLIANGIGDQGKKEDYSFDELLSPVKGYRSIIAERLIGRKA
jgi:hypothetical protein